MNLLMLTKFFPFGTGEAFIENEIEVLSAYYDNVLIIACEAPSETYSRKLPTNVTAKGIKQVSKLGKLADTVLGQKNFVFASPEVRKEKENTHSIKQECFLNYFEAKSTRVYREIERRGYLEELGAEPYAIYSYWLFVTARVAIEIKKKHSDRVAYMFTRAHRYDLYAEKNGTGYLPFRELFLESFDMVLPCSDNGTDYLVSRYPKYADKIQTSFLGTLDHGLGSKSTDGVFRIVSCSRVEPVKRVPLILEALELLDRKDVHIQWTHIGGGDALAGIQEKASALKNVKCVFTGNMPNQAVMNFYRENPADLFINVSSSEGLPVSIMEAISFGIPVMATDVGGTSEIVISGITGILLDEDVSPEELSKQIKRLYNMRDSDDYLSYQKQCRDYWESNFQAIENYNKMYRFVQENRNGETQ